MYILKWNYNYKVTTFHTFEVFICVFLRVHPDSVHGSFFISEADMGVEQV